jgi:hypothetical protein
MPTYMKSLERISQMASLLKGKLLTSSPSANNATTKPTIIDTTVHFPDSCYKTVYEKTATKFNDLKANTNTYIVSYATDNVPASRDARGKCCVIKFSDGFVTYIKRGNEYTVDMFKNMSSDRFNRLLAAEIILTATR